MRYVVTGGSGFIGASICSYLLNQGHELKVLDDRSRGSSLHLKDIEDQIQYIHGDVRDFDAVNRAVEGCEVVFHLAYVNGTRYFYEKPDLVLDVGIKGAINTIDAALANNVTRYVLASTGEVYNQPKNIPTTEDAEIIIPDIKNARFSYSGGKIASELLALHYGARKGLETVIFRPHNFYGPNMGNEHVIPEIINKILVQSKGLKEKEVEIEIQGDGSETRAFCYVSDGSRGACIAGLEGKSEEIYHIGKEEEISIRELVNTIAKLMNVTLFINSGVSPKGQTSRRCPSIKKISALGYVPEVTLEEGLQKSIDWYVSRSNSDL